MSTQKMTYKCPNCGDRREEEIQCHCTQNKWHLKFGGFEDNKGLFCLVCKDGWHAWTCKACGQRFPMIPKHIKLKDECFIATAAMGIADAPEVMTLRTFRNTYLAPSSPGRVFVRWYESTSPPLAQVIAKHPLLRRLVRTFLILPAARLARFTLKNQNF